MGQRLRRHIYRTQPPHEMKKRKPPAKTRRNRKPAVGWSEMVRRLARRFASTPGSFTATLTFPNDDVPKFLKALDDFERRSAKTKLMVKFKPSNGKVSDDSPSLTQPTQGT